jgi:hypothetical protein
LLAAQAPFDLSHEVFRKSQIIEGSLKGFGGVLRLAAITCEALLRCAITASSGFGVLCGISFVWGHGALLASVEVFGDCRLAQAHVTHTPTRL